MRAESVEEAGDESGGEGVGFKISGERLRGKLTNEDEHEKIENEEMKIGRGDHLY